MNFANLSSENRIRMTNIVGVDFSLARQIVFIWNHTKRIKRISYRATKRDDKNT